MGGSPVQTNFCLSPHFIYSRHQSLILERGVHRPSSAESLAPFYQDPTQRIIVLHTHIKPQYLALRAETLLELLKDRGGTEIGWDEWKNHVVVPFRYPSYRASRGVYVSGCRLFFVYPTSSGPYFQMQVYDFSMQGRTKSLGKLTIGGLGAVTHLSSTQMRARFPSEEFFCL